MELEALLTQLLLLPKEQQKIALKALESALGASEQEGDVYLPHLHQTQAWQEIQQRAREVVHQEKVCLIDFDDHILSINL